MTRLIKRFRLWRAKIFGPPIGEWQLDDPPNAWRLLPSGDYEYREMTTKEYSDHRDKWAW
jgi:hypothetical protein